MGFAASVHDYISICSFRSMTTFPFAASIQSTFPLKEDENCTDLEGMYMNMITWSSQYARDKVLEITYSS